MDNITNSLAEYSSTVNQYADKIGNALLPVASMPLTKSNMMKWVTALIISVRNIMR